jgi:hypothetical protein
MKKKKKSIFLNNRMTSTAARPRPGTAAMARYGSPPRQGSALSRFMEGLIPAPPLDTKAQPPTKQRPSTALATTTTTTTTGMTATTGTTTGTTTKGATMTGAAPMASFTAYPRPPMRPRTAAGKGSSAGGARGASGGEGGERAGVTPRSLWPTITRASSQPMDGEGAAGAAGRRPGSAPVRPSLAQTQRSASSSEFFQLTQLQGMSGPASLSSSIAQPRQQRVHSASSAVYPSLHRMPYQSELDDDDPELVLEDVDVPTARTRRLVEEDLAHTFNRTASRQLTRSVSAKSRKAQEEIERNRRQLEDMRREAQATLGGSAGNFHAAVLESKERGRTALFAHTQSNKMEAVRKECEAEADAAIRELLQQIQQVERQTVEDSRAAKDMELSRTGQRMDTKDIKHTISMLQQKNQQIVERSMRAEQELQKYADLEPVFGHLALGFDFGTPEGVVSQLESLERDHLDKYSEVLELRESRKKIEAEHQAYVESREADFHARTHELKQAQSRVARTIEALQQEVEMTRLQLAKAKTTRKSSRELAGAVVRLYKDWESAGEVRLDEPPDLDRPIQVVERFRRLFRRHPPNNTSLQLRTLATLANKLVHRFFKGEATLLFRPRDLYTALAALLASKDDHLHHLTTSVEREIKENTRLLGLLDTVIRKRRRAEHARDRWRAKWDAGDFAAKETREDEDEFRRLEASLKPRPATAPPKKTAMAASWTSKFSPAMKALASLKERSRKSILKKPKQENLKADTTDITSFLVNITAEEAETIAPAELPLKRKAVAGHQERDPHQHDQDGNNSSSTSDAGSSQEADSDNEKQEEHQV